jgi:hypothetical protein
MLRDKGNLMSFDIHPADARLRRVTLIVSGAACIAAVAALVLFRSWFETHIASLPEPAVDGEMRRLIGLSCIGLSLCVLLFAGYAAQCGRRVVETQCWPLPGARTIRDIRVRTGRDALAIGKTLNFTAVALLIVAIGIGLVSAHLLQAL